MTTIREQPKLFQNVGKIIGHGKTAVVFEDTTNKDNVIKISSMLSRQLKSPSNNSQQQIFHIYKYIQKMQQQEDDKKDSEQFFNNLFVRIVDIQQDDVRIRLTMKKIQPLENLTMKQQYRYIPQIKTLLEKLERLNICHSDFQLRNIGINKNDSLVLYDLDFIKFINFDPKNNSSPVYIEPRDVFVDNQDFQKYLQHTKPLCSDRFKVWSRVMSVFLVDNTKPIPPKETDLQMRRMGYKLIMFYNPEKKVKRFWDVSLTRFYSYKWLDGLTEDIIFKIFTSYTSDDCLALLKKFESKMVLLDEVITNLI